MNRRINSFSNQAAYEAALSGLSYPNISYIEATSGVVWNESAPLYSVTQSLDDICANVGVTSGLGNYAAGQQVTIVFGSSMVDYGRASDCEQCDAGDWRQYQLSDIYPEELDCLFTYGTRDEYDQDETYATLTFTMPASNVTFKAMECYSENDLCTECPDSTDCGCGDPCSEDPCSSPECEGYDECTCTGEGCPDPCSEDPCSSPECEGYDECTCTGEGCEEEEPTEEEPEE